MDKHASIDIGFKTLLVFQTLLRTRSVSGAADAMGVSQPTVSRSLGRLREHFSDPLFVRTQRSMEPTPLAIELTDTVDQILELYFSRLTQQADFNPQTSRRVFRIAASEIGHHLLLTALTQTLAMKAPGVQMKAVPLGFHSLIEELETGAVDIAFGAYPKLYAGVHERTLATEQYVCVARKGHPDIKRKLTLEKYLNAQHIIVSAQGMGHIHEQIERQLLALCPPENIRVTSHHFLSSVLLAEETNLVVTLPSRVVSTLGRRLEVNVFPPPIDISPFDIKLYWHERYHRDAANQWLRQLIAKEVPSG